MPKQLLLTIFTSTGIILSLFLSGFSIMTPSDPAEPVELIEAEVSEKGERGKRLFNFKCKACHSEKKRSTGPVLENICDKYPTEKDKAWLFAWIRNSEEMIHEQKDPKAIALWEKYDKAPMSSFKKLTDEDIRDILEYVQPNCFAN